MVLSERALEMGDYGDLSLLGPSLEGPVKDEDRETVEKIVGMIFSRERRRRPSSRDPVARALLKLLKEAGGRGLSFDEICRKLRKPFKTMAGWYRRVGVSVVDLAHAPGMRYRLATLEDRLEMIRNAGSYNNGVPGPEGPVPFLARDVEGYPPIGIELTNVQRACDLTKVEALKVAKAAMALALERWPAATAEISREPYDDGFDGVLISVDYRSKPYVGKDWDMDRHQDEPMLKVEVTAQIIRRALKSVFPEKQLKLSRLSWYPRWKAEEVLLQKERSRSRKASRK